jgi:hypothetical protein
MEGRKCRIALARNEVSALRNPSVVDPIAWVPAAELSLSIPTALDSVRSTPVEVTLLVDAALVVAQPPFKAVSLTISKVSCFGEKDGPVCPPPPPPPQIEPGSANHSICSEQPLAIPLPGKAMWQSVDVRLR